LTTALAAGGQELVAGARWGAVWIVQLGNINNDIATPHATTDSAYTSPTACVYAPRKSTASARSPGPAAATSPARSRIIHQIFTVW